MPRLGFLSIFGGGQRGSSGGVEVVTSTSVETSVRPCDTSPRDSPPRTPTKCRTGGHWSPPQPRPLACLERSSSHELPRSLTASGSWDEAEPPSPIITLPVSSPPDSRPLTDGEINNASLQRAERRRRSSRDVIKEAVTKIFEDKANRERSVRRRGCAREGLARPQTYGRRRDKPETDMTPDTDDDAAADAGTRVRQRRQRKDRLPPVDSNTDGESNSESGSEDSLPPSPSSRPNIAKRASNFFMKSFKAMSATIRLNKKYVPTYYLNGTHELPEPDQILNRFGHSLDSQLEARRPSMPEPRSMCVVWDLVPEDTEPVRECVPEQESSPQTRHDARADPPPAGELPAPNKPLETPATWEAGSREDDEHIYEDVTCRNSDPPVSVAENVEESDVYRGGEGFLAEQEEQHRRISRVVASPLTLPEDMSQPLLPDTRQDSPYPRRCRGFRSLSSSPLPWPPRPPIPLSTTHFTPPPQRSPQLSVPPRLPLAPPSPLVVSSPRSSLLLSPQHPHSPGPLRSPLLRSPLLSRPLHPSLLPRSPVSRSLQPPWPPVPARSLLTSESRRGSRSTAAPQPPPEPGSSSHPPQVSEIQALLGQLHVPRASGKVQLPPERCVENARNIAHRRKGCKISPLTICLPRDNPGIQYELEEDVGVSTSCSPIYAQPFALSPGPCGTPSYSTPFKDIYSLTPTMLSPTDPPLDAHNSPLMENVFFGQDFRVGDRNTQPGSQAALPDDHCIQPDTQASLVDNQDIHPVTQASRVDNQDIQVVGSESRSDDQNTQFGCQDFQVDDQEHIQLHGHDSRVDAQDMRDDGHDSRVDAQDMHDDGRDFRVDGQDIKVDVQDFQVDDGYATLSPPQVQHCQDRHRDSAYFSTDESTDAPASGDQQGPVENPPWPPWPASSTKLLRQAIEHTLVDNLTRLPEMIASEVNRQVRQTLQASTTEIAAKIQKITEDVSSDFTASSVCLPGNLSSSQQYVNNHEDWMGNSNVGSQLGPKRPSTLDLLGYRRRKHTYSYSCQDLVGEDMFPPGLRRTCRPSRVSAALSFADLGYTDEDISSGGLVGLSDHTTSLPAHLQHLHRGGDYRYVVEHSFPEVEVEGNLMELPHKHHLPITEALKPLCRELSRSYLMKEGGEDGGGGRARTKNLLLKLNVNMDQMDGYQSDTSMEWDYFDQPDGEHPDSDHLNGT
ncbi:uncharacterized protein [Panulirus ornatus]|uniref:uncharacterized protein n=1 Tax=Panulirus ornatus TaxID=150431 RepID=UPI003A87C763